jgi:hypothetical protein
MSIDLSTITPKQRKTRNRGSYTKAPQNVYVARFQNEIYKVSKDRAECEEAIKAAGKGSVEEYGSRRSLPPSVTLAVFKQSPTLAGVFTGLGGRWGTQSQNEANREAIAKHLREAFDALNLARKMAKKDPVELPTVADGEWRYITTTTQKGLDANEVKGLNALAEEFSDMFGEDADEETADEETEINA